MSSRARSTRRADAPAGRRWGGTALVVGGVLLAAAWGGAGAAGASPAATTPSTVPLVTSVPGASGPQVAAAKTASLGRSDFRQSGWLVLPRTSSSALEEMSGVLDGTLTCDGSTAPPQAVVAGQSAAFTGLLVHDAPEASSYTFVYDQPVGAALPAGTPSAALGRCAGGVLEQAYAAALAKTRTVADFRESIQGLPAAARAGGVRGFLLRTSYVGKAAGGSSTPVHSDLAVLDRGNVVNLVSTFAGSQPFNTPQLRALVVRLSGRLRAASATLNPPTGPPAPSTTAPSG